jgi:hypothetical protein
MTLLRIGPGLSLPPEAVTETFGIIAKRGVGKTYTALVLVEEMLEAGLTAIVADPVGVCWGLRSGANGKTPGYPILILGGEHGDVPLEATAGEVVADFLITERQSAVLDLSLFRKGEQVRFMADFAERLYHRNREPLHLVLDEADAFAPQKPMHGQERMLGAIEDLVRRGRARGIGVTLVTQRAAVLNKDVLTQVEVLVALRTIAPQDRDAIDAWIRVHGTPDERARLMESLPSLPIGEAWFWSPGWLDIFKRIKVRERRTFDSSATPKVGRKVVKPKRLAAIDISKLKSRMAETIERAAQADPKTLRDEVLRLKRHNALLQRAQAAAEASATAVAKAVPPKPIEKWLLTEKDRETLEGMVEHLEVLTDQLKRAVEHAGGLREIAGEALDAADKAKVAVERGLQMEKLLARNPTVTQMSQAGLSIHLVPGKPTPYPRSLDEMKANVSGLRKGERLMLQVLAQRYPVVVTKAQLATLAHLSVKGGTFGTYFGVLKRRGLLAEEFGGRVVITDAGMAVCPPPSEPLTREGTIGMWMRSLRAGERKMLQFLIEAYPGYRTYDEVGQATQITPQGGTFGTYLGVLHRNGLVEKDGRSVRASQALMEA